MDLRNKSLHFYVYLALGLILSAILLFKAVLPQMKTWDSLKKELIQRDTELKRRYAIVQEKEKLAREIAKIEQNYGNMDEMFFRLDDVSQAVKEIARISQDLQMEFSSLVPSPAQKLENLSAGIGFTLWETPISIRMKTGYLKLLDFIKRIENSGKVLKIKNFSVRKNTTNLLIHDIEMTLGIYSLQKEEPPKEEGR